MTTSAPPSTTARIVEGGAFVSCILLAFLGAVAFVVWRSPEYQDAAFIETTPLWKAIAETSTRVLVLALPFAVLILLPLQWWIGKRLRSPVLVVITLTAATAGLGLIMLLAAALIGGGSAFLAIQFAVGAIWSAAVGGTLFYLLRRIPVVLVASAVVIVTACLLGTFVG